MKRLGLAGLLLCVVLLVSSLLAHPALNNFVAAFTDTNGGGFTRKDVRVCRVPRDTPMTEDIRVNGVSR